MVMYMAPLVVQLAQMALLRHERANGDVGKPANKHCKIQIDLACDTAVRCRSMAGSTRTQAPGQLDRVEHVGVGGADRGGVSSPTGSGEQRSDDETR
ncbi:hypothetical protein [Sorangium sp. So ce394]|uniref:hypothetical protein n=1 Tax=Sorangium sp. So ce394 TaxID=3133310 RepID=UPI003F5B3857